MMTATTLLLSAARLIGADLSLMSRPGKSAFLLAGGRYGFRPPAPSFRAMRPIISDVFNRHVETMMTTKMTATGKEPFFSSSRSLCSINSTKDVGIVQPLSVDQLRWTCDPEQFHFETTRELDDLDALLGQERAESAIEFGVGMHRDGYNLYVLGPPGSGKRTVVQNYLQKRAKDEPKPSDWCYVHNFNDTDRPRAIQLPPGRGRQLQEDIEKLIEDVQFIIPAALDETEHRNKLERAEKSSLQPHEQDMSELAKEARDRGLMLIRTPNGVALADPSLGERGGGGAGNRTRSGGDDHDEDDDEKHTRAERQKAVEEAIEELQPKLRQIVQNLSQLTKLAREKMKELNREEVRRAMDSLLAPLKAKYADLEDDRVVEHLRAIEEDVIEHYDQIRPPGEDAGTMSPLLFLQQQQREKLSFGQYKINLIIDHAETNGAPVIYVDHPYYHNLMGRIDHESHLGSLFTNFALIKPGALHRANGGYLVLNARDVLLQPFSWEALKRALGSHAIQIESLGAELSLISTVSLQPEPIPLHVKVVLLGDRLLFYLLHEYDTDFVELFKVLADFNDETDCSPESLQLYARLFATLSRSEKTKPMNREAVALMIEQAARNAGDQGKLSTHMRSHADLLRESDYWADVDGSDVIHDTHVRKAIQQQIYRVGRIKELVQEEIRRGTLLVDVKGKHVGQVNGLSVVSLGNSIFGRPSRITATARLGRGKVVDIEREVEMGGPTHSKGVMILSSLLAARYALDRPLSLSASLVFEQSYGMVDGDSASVAEFCALMSSLSGVPIKQNLAVTGSLNQHGQAQAIGGVNEKVEGFFDVCSTIGLTGDQGVLIPASNVKHLMLRPDVVEAVREGKFSVYAYNTVDDAVTLLTGVQAGEKDSDGVFPPETVNFLVDCRLRELADLMIKTSEKMGVVETEESK